MVSCTTSVLIALLAGFILGWNMKSMISRMDIKGLIKKLGG